MLCADCSADDHEFTTSGYCQHEGYSSCTCEYSDTDPEFNARWFDSPFISIEQADVMLRTAQLGRAALAASGMTAFSVRRARAYARHKGAPVADLAVEHAA